MKKLFALFLAVALLGVHLPFAITTHYCAGMAVKSALVWKGNTVDCGMNTADVVHQFETNTKNTATLENSSCCQNLSQVFEITDDYQQTSNVSVSASSLFHTAVLMQYVRFFVEWIVASASQNSFDYQLPSPPLLKRDVLIFFQCFLI